MLTIYPERLPIKYTRLTCTKIKGGIGLPDLYKYYLACHPTRIADWNIHYNKKLWVYIENSFSRFPIQDLLRPRHRPTESLTHPLIHPPLVAFTWAAKSTTLSSVPGPLATLRGNPDFPPGNIGPYLSREWPYRDMRMQHFFSKGTPCSYDHLVDMSLTKSFPFWTYRQIQNFLFTQPTPSTWTRQLTPFESLCKRKTPQRHLISFIYTLLLEEPNTTSEPALKAWDRELPYMNTQIRAP